MRSQWKILLLLLICLCLVFTGCGLRTVDQLYCVPKRSDAEKDLQSVIDEAMDGLSYSAPISGENRQVTQMVDLDGDGVEECLLFAKDDSEKPLKILIFCQLASGYVLMDTIEGYGFGFDFISFAQLDGQPGMEIIVGRQVSNDIMRSVSVYRFSSGFSRQLMSTSYTKAIISDLDRDGARELLLLTSGESEDSNGVLSLYRFIEGQLQQADAISFSQPIQQLKRASVGRLQDGSNAVYITSLTKENTLLTDVIVLQDHSLSCVFQADPVQPLGSHNVYPADLNGDGIMELGRLISMPEHPTQSRSHSFVGWYSVRPDGSQTEKMLTYMNFNQGWYMTLQESWRESLSVIQSVGVCTFYMWDPEHIEDTKVLTVHALTDSDRETVAQEEKYTILYQGDAVIYAAEIEDAAADYGITPLQLQSAFHMMRTELNTEEN